MFRICALGLFAADRLKTNVCKGYLVREPKSFRSRFSTLGIRSLYAIISNSGCE